MLNREVLKVSRLKKILNLLQNERHMSSLSLFDVVCLLQALTQPTAAAWDLLRSPAGMEHVGPLYLLSALGLQASRPHYLLTSTFGHEFHPSL